MTIRTLIVDDEELARLRIRELLQDEGDVEVVGEAADGAEALQRIEADAPDLVFLDIQMPEMTGFEVLETVDVPRMPVVVFVTAYDEFALRAFEAHAVDYLLKPFYRPRFAVALERARAQVAHRSSGEVDARLRALLGALPSGRPYLSRFVVRLGPRIQFVRAEEVDWMEADGNYVRLHAGARDHLLRETLSGLVTRLDPERFLRVHRSVVVNADRIREVQALGKGSYVLILADGTRVTSSSTFREAVERLIGDHR